MLVRRVAAVRNRKLIMAGFLVRCGRRNRIAYAWESRIIPEMVRARESMADMFGNWQAYSVPLETSSWL